MERLPREEAVRVHEMNKCRLFLHYLVFPIMWLLDRDCLANREWFHLPLLKYLISITNLIIGIAFSRLCVAGVEYRATEYDVDKTLVILILATYAFGALIVSLILLHYLRPRVSRYHFNYFGMTCANVVGYGLMYFFVYIQYAYYSDTIEESFNFFIYLLVSAFLILGIFLFIKQFCFFNIFTHIDDNILENHYRYDPQSITTTYFRAHHGKSGFEIVENDRLNFGPTSVVEDDPDILLNVAAGATDAGTSDGGRSTAVRVTHENDDGTESKQEFVVTSGQSDIDETRSLLHRANNDTSDQNSNSHGFGPAAYTSLSTSMDHGANETKNDETDIIGKDKKQHQRNLSTDSYGSSENTREAKLVAYKHRLLDKMEAEPTYEELTRQYKDYSYYNAWWETLYEMNNDMWHMSIGFILTECVVYVFVGSYVNLDGDWSDEESTVLTNLWSIIVFGLILAVITGIMEAVIEIQCKAKCYIKYESYINNPYYSPESFSNCNEHCCESMLVFCINWSNRMSSLWLRVLAATIGWSLVTPNQTNSVAEQFGTAIAATLLFVFVGFMINDYKRRIKKELEFEIIDLTKEKDILTRDMEKLHNAIQDEAYAKGTKLNEINADTSTKIDDEKVATTSVSGVTAYKIELREKEARHETLEKEITILQQKLVMYDQLHDTYDLAFAVAVSYAWENFAELALEDSYGDEGSFEYFIADLIYAIVISLLFTQLGLELSDYKQQRVFEAKTKHGKDIILSAQEREAFEKYQEQLAHQKTPKK